MAEAVRSSPDWVECQQVIGYVFRDLNLLQRAMTHKSMAVRPADPLSHNEVLEFLGDAVLELAVTDYLVRKWGHQYLEGELTKRRTYIINSTVLTQVSQRLGLDRFVRTRPEKTAPERFLRQLLADTFEALVGAIYLDSDFETARGWVLRVLRPELEALEQNALPWVDYRSLLQEYIQAFSPELPEYRLMNVSGPEHARWFEIGIYYKGQLLGQGVGATKKQAAQAAARATLLLLQDPERREALGLTAPPPPVEPAEGVDSVPSGVPDDGYPSLGS